MSDSKQFTYISAFSGIEAATVAWKPLGWKPLAFSEIDDFPSAVLAYHYPDVPNLGDITKVNWKDVVAEHGRPDVVIGGSPCQSFSIAGGRESLGGESRLMFEYIRACDEIHSPWIVWENVPGVLNVRDNAFAQLLVSLQDVGYVDLAWRVLDAQFVRVPVRDDNGEIVGWFGPVAQRRRRVFLVGHLGTGGCASAVLFESESVRGNTTTSKQKRKELATAVGRGSQASSRKGELADPNDIGAYAFKVRCGKDTYIKTDGSVGTAGKGALISEEQAFTVATTQDQTILARASDAANSEICENLSPTLLARIYKQPPFFVGPNEYVSEPSSTVKTSDGSEWVVRRLMPIECERLQGFPDGYTDIPYGKKAKTPDGKRYKALGNSMAVPCIRWIGERIQMVQEVIDEMEEEQ